MINRELKQLKEEKGGENMSAETEDIEIVMVEDEETQKEISGVLWTIFILTFISQTLTAAMFLLTNPIATWQAALVMVIMAAQGTIIGGALKMLTKKLDFIRDKLDKSTTENTKTSLEKGNLSDKIKMLEKEITRQDSQLINRDAEILKLKQELYNR